MKYFPQTIDNFWEVLIGLVYVKAVFNFARVISSLGPLIVDPNNVDVQARN